MVFEKKIKREFFCRVYAGEKRFELRKDEDGVSPGDVLVLRECDQDHYTGRYVECRVRYVLRDCPEYGLMPGYCIIGF